MTFKMLKPLLLVLKSGVVLLSSHSLWARPAGATEHAVPLLDDKASKDRPSSQTDGSNHNPELALFLGLSLKNGLAQRTVRWKVLQKTRRLGAGYLLAALPRFMLPGGLRQKKKLLPTAYLDGLRGWAAIIVLNFHTFQHAHSWLTDHFSLVVAGREMVDTFFIISGYVLSYQMLRSIRNQETARMLDSLASSIFRRYLRLCFSTGAATLIAMLMVQLGWMDGQKRLPTFAKGFMHWIHDLVVLSNPFAHIPGHADIEVPQSDYLRPTWTIPVEFRGSMLVFIFCAAVCKLSTKHRMILCWGMIVLSYFWQAIYAALFLLGLFIADVSLGRHPERLKTGVQLPQHDIDSAAPEKPQSIAVRVGYVIMFLVALFLLQQTPRCNQISFVAKLLCSIQPDWPRRILVHFWSSFGAALLVFALESYPVLQNPLKTHFSQYLGEISFGIYTMHTLIYKSIYKNYLIPLSILYLGNSAWAYIPAVILNYVAVLWAADYFTRIDDRLVQLGRYLQTTTFLKWEN